MTIRVPKGGIKDRKDLIAWAASFTYDERAKYGRIMTHRIAMRVLPLLNPEHLFRIDSKKSVIAFSVAVFRANLSARVLILSSSREEKLLAAAYAVAAARSVVSLYKGVAVEVRGVLDAAYRANTAGGSDVDYEVNMAVEAAIFAAGIYDSWEAVSCDAQILTERNPQELIATGLWSGKAPDWWREALGKLRTLLLQPNGRDLKGAVPNWQVWLDWYEARAQGVVPWGLTEVVAHKIERRIALGDGREDFWKRDDSDINSEITDWVQAAREEAVDKTKPMTSDAGGSSKGVWGDEGQSLVETAASEIQWDFFISYSSRDENMAREIDEIVRSTGYSTFVQFRDFGPGTNLVREMQRGLANAGRVIALYSPDYETSDHCQAEWSAAYNADPGSAKGKLLPFLLRPTELNMLARQIVYTDLVGLDTAGRKQAVLRALAYKPEPRSKTDLKKVLSEIQTPIPVAEAENGKEKVGLASNPDLDTPLSDNDLRELPGWLIDLSVGILASLPGNTPPAFRVFLELYQKHLIERGARPHTDRLRSFVGPLRKEFEGVESSLWSPGLEDAIQDFLKKHELLVTHYPLPEARERALSETPIDEAAATGIDLIEPIHTAVEALKDLSKFDMTTEEFDAFVDNVLRAADEYAQMQLTAADEARPQTEITPKRRYVLTTAGFFERTAALIAASVTIGATPQGQAAISALRQSVEKLLAFAFF